MKRKYFDNVAAALFKVVKHMHYDEVLKLIILLNILLYSYET